MNILQNIHESIKIHMIILFSECAKLREKSLTESLLIFELQRNLNQNKALEEIKSIWRKLKISFHKEVTLCLVSKNRHPR